MKKVIFGSSAVPIYGETEKIPTGESFPARPRTPLGIAKLAAELYFRFYLDNYGLAYVILRYTNVYGPRQTFNGDRNVVPAFIKCCLEDKQPVVFGNGHQTRDFVYIDDVIRANMMAFANRVQGVYNVGTGRQTTISELLRMIGDEVGQCPAERFMSLPAWPENSCVNIEKIRGDLNWKPGIELVDGIAQTVAWMKEDLTTPKG